MDSLLEDIQNETIDQFIEAVAYADDLALVVKGDSRVELEKRSNDVLNILSTWCIKHKLNISIGKTTVMILKGKPSKNRLPILQINNNRIKFSNTVKYLGIILDDKLSFVEHAKFLRNKILNFVMALRRVPREYWRLRSHIINILYGAVVLPIVNYGSGFWYRTVQNIHVMRHLLAIQGFMLIVVCGVSVVSACTTGYRLGHPASIAVHCAACELREGIPTPPQKVNTKTTLGFDHPGVQVHTCEADIYLRADYHARLPISRVFFLLYIF